MSNGNVFEMAGQISSLTMSRRLQAEMVCVVVRVSLLSFGMNCTPYSLSLGTRPSENWKEGLGDRLRWKCTERNVWNL